MNELTSKLSDLRISHDIEYIDTLILKLKESSYVASTTRGRVVKLIQQEVQTPELVQLVAIFSQSTATYIPRAIVRKTLVILEDIKTRSRRSPPPRDTWMKEEWFCMLVDSDEVIESFRGKIDDLGVCRYNVVSPSCTIVMFGKLDEDKFFTNLLSANDSLLCGMTNEMARSLFKYHSGVEIEGSLDCAHLTAGNDMKSVDVTAAHVVPNIDSFKMIDDDVAFIFVNELARSECNPLHFAPYIVPVVLSKDIHKI